MLRLHSNNQRHTSTFRCSFGFKYPSKNHCNLLGHRIKHGSSRVLGIALHVQQRRRYTGIYPKHLNGRHNIISNQQSAISNQQYVSWLLHHVYLCRQDDDDLKIFVIRSTMFCLIACSHCMGRAQRLLHRIMLHRKMAGGMTATAILFHRSHVVLIEALHLQ